MSAITSTNNQLTNVDIDKKFEEIESDLGECNENTTKVLDANAEIAAATQAANDQEALEDAQAAKSAGQGLQAAGSVCTALSAIPGVGAGFAVAGASLSIAGACTTQGGAIAESEVTNDPNAAIAATGDLAKTTDEGIKDIQTATAETTLEGEASLA